MAILGTLREKGGKWVAIFVGLALLLFLVSSLFGDQNFSMFGNSNTNPTVMEIGGKKIDMQSFESQMAVTLKTREMNGMSVDEEMRTQLRLQVANQLFNDIAISPILDKLGLTISDKEIGELLFGNDPHPFVKQYFGQQYSPERAKNFIKNEYTNDLKAKLAFDEYTTAIKTQVRASKYNKLIIAGLRASSFDADVSSAKSGTKVFGKIVVANYLSIPDSTVSVSDREIKSFINKNADDYKGEPSRDLEYVSWNIAPSKQDSLEALEMASSLKISFETNTDTTFAQSNSEIEQNLTFRDHGSFNSADETAIFNTAVGSIAGPVAAEGGYGLYKILSKTNGPTTFYNFSQIVLNFTQDSAGVYNRANQIIGDLKTGSSFSDAAKRNSVDPSSANGGNMGWVSEAPYIPVSVIDYLKKNGKGSLGMIKGQQGLHIIQINENASNEQVKVESVIKKINIGRNTMNEMFGLANNFANEISAKDELDFTKKASEKGYTVKNATSVIEGATGWAGMNNAREIIKWTYEENRKVGEISQPFNVDNLIIVARVRKIVEEGTKSFEELKDEVKLKLINKKKGVILAKKMEEAMKEAKEPVALAIKFSTIAQPIENAEFYQSNMLYVGSDYKVQGAILGMKKGDKSKPIIGEQGVYVFFCEDVKTEPLQGNTAEIIASIQSQYTQNVESIVDDILRKKAKLKNNLAKYY